MQKVHIQKIRTQKGHVHKVHIQKVHAQKSTHGRYIALKMGIDTHDQTKRIPESASQENPNA